MLPLHAAAAAAAAVVAPAALAHNVMYVAVCVRVCVQAQWQRNFLAYAGAAAAASACPFQVLASCVSQI